ncbi:DNA-dependent RNA polymerase subunit rpo19 [Squirrelpox virus]|uniref:DNA-directed RNA polymerase 19 kDa subunit n=1 Tax=Squirrelpox virus TaxID=240426 RepID=U3UBK0_9POXV|nr:DNA-dependent RNA polymerase subunit rpo19 [Squirrelpox virus]CCD83276.1 DNA-dependent RNA polymerase subunit rpo19 [Squirrelpox virus]
MAESGDVAEFVSPGDVDEDEPSDFDEEEDKSPDTSDVRTTSQASLKVEYVSDAQIMEEDPQSLMPKQVSARVEALKRRYTRRISLFELTGILAESYNLLQRGRIPLVQDLSDETLRQRLLHVVVREIEEGTCPIVVEKNGEMLSVRDFDQAGLRHHLDFVIKIWKQQHRY